jgi:hypothetical protein
MRQAAVLIASGRASSSTRVPNQIAFWLFVLKEALELHVPRTLALIAAHPTVHDRVRDEVRNMMSRTPEAVDGLPILDACISEQLRLWTPVPILVRRVVNPFSLRGEIPIEAGRQMMIHTGF